MAFTRLEESDHATPRLDRRVAVRGFDPLRAELADVPRAGRIRASPTDRRRPSTGTRRPATTCCGRRRSPAWRCRARSSGAIACSCRRRVSSDATAGHPHRALRRRRDRRRTCRSTRGSSSRSTSAPARCCGSASRTRAFRRRSGIRSPARRRRRRSPTDAASSSTFGSEGLYAYDIGRQAAAGTKTSASSTPAGSTIPTTSGASAARRSSGRTWSSCSATSRRTRSSPRSTSRPASRPGAPRAKRSRRGPRRRFSRTTARTELVTQATTFIRGYDPENGQRAVAAVGKFRDHDPDADRRSGRHHRHQRLPRRAADLRDQARGERATSR